MKKISIFLLSFLIVTLGSCSKAQLDKINTDPTKLPAESYNPDELLSTAQFKSSNKGYYQLLYQSTMMQLLASTYLYYNNGDKYVNAGSFTDYQGRIFDEGYADASTIREMQRLARDKDPVAYSNLINIGDIMFVLILQRITDTYGDIPYSQASKAREGIKYPVYDKQEDIYNSMLTDLDKAIHNLDPSKPKPSTDLFYKGDINQWKKFGYSLMLKVAMRLTKIAPDKARLWVEKAAAAGVFSDNSDNAIVLTDESNLDAQNGTSLALRTISDYREVRWSKTLIDELRKNDDPRLGVIAEVPQSGLANNMNEKLAGNTDAAVQLGLPNGYDLSGGAFDISKSPEYAGGTGTGADFAPLGKYSRPRTAVYLKLSGPNFIMTYSEIELLLAEAKIRGWNVPGTAAGHYANGLRGGLQTMRQLDQMAAIPEEAINVYVMKHPLDESSSDKAFEMINTQYWITTGTSFNFIESWMNWKRSGYPVLTPVNYPGNVTNGTIPRRLIYLSTEVLNNTDNYRAAVARLPGGDLLTSRTWWDR
ncbi:SusD/RagB family nutrient-binding outer membrane lipoprotein [Pedobacter sp. PAMC26386]|nr:SusD/RagB family nutrient-binding outer membrane lipoprotein [Pedobacter sp. PAMC26386]